MKKLTSKDDAVFNLIINFLLVVIVLIVLYPLYFVIIASVSTPEAVNGGEVLFKPEGFSFDGYKKIFGDMRIWNGYKNTLIYTLFGTLLGVFATLLAGYSLSRKDLPGRKIIMGMFIFTMYFNGGLIPTYMVVKGLDLINKPLVMIILGSVGVYNIIIARTFFQTTISNELLEAAMIDGCTNGVFFFKIVLPVSKAVTAVIALYYAVQHWNAFFNALIYLHEQKFYPLQLVLREILVGSQTVMQNITDIESLGEQQRMAEQIKYGVIIVSSLPVLIMYPFVQKFFVKGVMIGSVKG